jgi:hypothetical protein
MKTANTKKEKLIPHLVVAVSLDGALKSPFLLILCKIEINVNATVKQRGNPHASTTLG